MNIANSDADSPPVKGHVWSPQYSPAKLAELVPVRNPLALNNPHHSGSNAAAQSHPQRGSSDTSRPAEIRGSDKHLDSQSRHTHQPPHAQAMHHRQTQGSFSAGGHSFPDTSPEQGHPSTNQLCGVSERPPSPPPPPRSHPMHNRPYSPSYALDTAKLPHHSTAAPPEQSLLPVHQWQDHQSPDEQRMMRHHHREGAYSTAGPQHAAPAHNVNQYEQQLQQSHQLPYSPTRPDTHSLRHQQHAVLQHSSHHRLNSSSQHDGVPSSDGHHLLNPPGMHPQPHGSYGATHAPDRQAHWQGHVEQGSATQGLGSRQAGHARPVPAHHASQHLLHDQSPQGLPAASWVQEPHPYPHHRQDLAVHIKPEPGKATPPNLTVHPVDLKFHRAPSDHHSQLQPQPQAATVLSPELSAALAAGVFKQSLATIQQTAKQHEHEHQPAQPNMRPQQLGGNDVASVLPPELSAALASGQLNFQLGRSDAASHSQQAGQHAYEPGQAPFPPGQAAYQPDQAACQPEEAPFQPKSPAAYGPWQAASQPGQAIYHSGQVAPQPEQAALQSGQAAYQPEQGANQFGQAAYQPERSQANHWAIEHPRTSADPVGLVQRQHHLHLPVSVADSHQGSWQTSHNAGFGVEKPLQMTMNGPTLGTHHHAAASHIFAVGPRPLPASPSGLQLKAANDQHPLHDAQHAGHRLMCPQQIPQHRQHVPEQAHHVPQHAQHLPQQTQHVPQQVRHVPQQAQHVPQQAQHAPQQAQHVPQQAQHLPRQAQQGLQPEDHAVWQAHFVSHSKPFESAARSDPMLSRHAQHGPVNDEVQRHAGYSEHKVRHLLPTTEYLAQQQWQAQGAHDGECFALSVCGPGTMSLPGNLVEMITAVKQSRP